MRETKRLEEELKQLQLQREKASDLSALVSDVRQEERHFCVIQIQELVERHAMVCVSFLLASGALRLWL